MEAQDKVMIETLLKYKANPNITDHEEIGMNTPVHKATEKNMIDVVDLFLECGCDPTIANKNGFTALHIAARNGYYDMCKLLLARGKLLVSTDTFE